MSRRTRRKRRHCGQLFRPDPRNVRHQRYCSAPACRRASKAASQRRWLAKAANRDYFRDPLRVLASLESDDKIVALAPPRLQGAASPRARTTRPVCDAGMGLGAMVDMWVTPDQCVSSLVVSQLKRPRPV